MEKTTAQAAISPFFEPSLLDYLQTPGRAGLRIALVQNPVSVSGKRLPLENPFSSMGGCSPWVRIFPADLTMGADAELMAIFLVVQSDRYPSVDQTVSPVNNVGIETCWKGALDRYQRELQSAFPIAPTVQKDPQGRWVPFKPLFYCRRTARFGHPICPDCGAELGLCRDDQLLAAFNLPTYSRSLERFLYCEQCHAARRRVNFYSRRVDVDMGPRVRDCSGLLRDLGGWLLSAKGQGGCFPCINCDQIQQCHGESGLVAERMTAVRFYPFYMLMAPAPSLNLGEYIMLLSAASLDEIIAVTRQRQKAVRLECLQRLQTRLGRHQGFFFKDAPNRFLEILYLKLTLMEEMMALDCANAITLGSPADQMGLDGYWVRLEDQARRLPFLWGFNLQLIDHIGSPVFSTLGTPLQIHQRRLFWGMAWFQILLANARQDADRVYACLADLVTREAAIDLEIGIPDELSAVLAPANLFWRVESFQLDSRAESLWRKSLALGLALLKAGAATDAGWSEQQFMEQLTVLREDIHQVLFHAPASTPASVTTGSGRDDVHIAAIVKAIARRWPDQEATTPPAPVVSTDPALAVQADADGDVVETVVLESPLRPSDDELEKTVMMAPRESGFDKSGREPRVPDTPRIPGQTQDLEKTMILSKTGSGNDPEALEQTVVMARNHTATGQNGLRQGHTPAADRNGDGGDDLEATVIIDPRQIKNRKPKP